MAKRDTAAKRLKRYALVAAGSVCVVLGAIGVVVPLLPTTPFLLLAAACFIRSSPTLYQWLIRNRVLGQYIKHYREGTGMPLWAKLVTLCLLWLVLGYSAFRVVETSALRGLLVLIGMGVSVYVLFRRPMPR